MDVFGQALLDYAGGDRRASYLVRRDDGFTETQPVEKHFQDFCQWSQVEQEAVNLAVGRVLDVGAGAGKYSLYLQDKGMDVYPIDASSGAVKVMKERGLKRVAEINLPKISYSEAFFDSILLMNSFGIVGDPSTAKEVLRRFQRLLTPQGRLIITFFDLSYNAANGRMGKMAGQVTLRLEYKKHSSDWFNLLLVSPKELGLLAVDAGWKKMEIISSEDSYYTSVLTHR